MRKLMTKEVTKTNVKLAQMVMEDGQPKAITLPDEVLIGNITQERAQRELNKKFDHPVTVFGVEPETTVYEMEVEEFIKYARVKEDDQEETEEI